MGNVKKLIPDSLIDLSVPMANLDYSYAKGRAYDKLFDLGKVYTKSELFGIFERNGFFCKCQNPEELFQRLVKGCVYDLALGLFLVFRKQKLIEGSLGYRYGFSHFRFDCFS